MKMAAWQLQTGETMVELITGLALRTLQQEQMQDQNVQSPLANCSAAT